MDIEAFFLKKILSKVLDECISYSKSVLGKSESGITCTKQEIQENLENHIVKIQEWSSQISFRDSKGPKITSNIYIPLNIYIYPKRLQLEQDEHIDKIKLDEIFDRLPYHCLLLGRPGAGKTTSLKHIVNKIITEEQFYSDRYNFPIVIRLRDLNKQFSNNEALIHMPNSLIFSQLSRVMGIKFSFSDLVNKDLENEDAYLIERVVIRFLEELRVLLILDGFDEVSSDRKDLILKEIRDLTSQLCNSTVILTSRTGEFDAHIDNVSHYEICDLNKNQIVEFASKWLGKKSKGFIDKLKDIPYTDVLSTPISVAHLCAIYERYGSLPKKPKTVYRKIVNLLLEEWDEQRSINRASKYAEFGTDRKFEFLCNLAYELTTVYELSVFSTEDLVNIYSEIFTKYDLKENEAKKVANEIESHTGLFLQTGYQSYEFSHKSIQEYLCAEYLVKLPKLPTNDTLIKIPNELAIATSLSSDPSLFFVELILNRMNKIDTPHDFYSIYIRRMLREKPEFEANDHTVISLCVLFTKYVQYCSENMGARSSEVIDSYDKLYSELSKRNKNGNILFRYYDTDADILSMAGIKIASLDINAEGEKHNFPSYLYAKYNFIGRKE